MRLPAILQAGATECDVGNVIWDADFEITVLRYGVDRKYKDLLFPPRLREELQSSQKAFRSNKVTSTRTGAGGGHCYGKDPCIRRSAKVEVAYSSPLRSEAWPRHCHTTNPRPQMQRS